MDFEQETFFGLHFEARHEDGSHHVLPVQNLIYALEGLQRTIHLVAMMKEGRGVKSRARVTRDIEDRYQLHCQPAEEGSFYQPTFVADKNQTLLSHDEINEVSQITQNLLERVYSGNERLFNEAVADSAYRAPIMASLGKMFDSRDKHYRLSVKNRRGEVIADSFAAADHLERFRQSRLSPDTHSIVTGFFNKVDFKERKLSLLIPNTGRSISCIYEEDIEQDLLSNARDLIQVVGTIELDDDGNPHRITDVQEVHEVNTDNIYMEEILPEHLVENGENDIFVSVELSEDKQTYFATLEVLEIDHAAYTRNDLISALQAEIEFLWNNIALEEDESLAPKARSLKVELHRLFKEAT